MAIHLVENLVSSMRRMALSSYPEECCGFLLGRSCGGERVALTLRPVRNEEVPADRRRRYLILPRTVWECENRAREDGLEIVGIYHSHPEDGPEPSAADIRYAWPGRSYVILGTPQEGPGEMRSWVLRHDRSGFAPETIQLRRKDPRPSENRS